jgi:hypothetical protein
LFTEIDFCIVSVYEKDEPRGSANFRPGSNPEQGIHAMPKADSVHSTLPTNTPSIRRRFLSAAGLAAGSTGDNSARVGCSSVSEPAGPR